MNGSILEIPAPQNKHLKLKVKYGHFATCHSHINMYLDITAITSNYSAALEASKVIAKDYLTTTAIDTIVCLDGTKVIGSCVAYELCNANLLCLNTKDSIHIVAPEYNTHGQIMFRDNLIPHIKNKSILLLAGSITTGHSIEKCFNSISYYGGRMIGIHSIFSALDKIGNLEIHGIYTPKELSQYESYSISECPHCKDKNPLEALVDSYGYLKL